MELFYYNFFFFSYSFFQICFRKTASSYFGILLQTSILNKSDHCRCPLPTPGGVIMLFTSAYYHIGNVSVWNQELINIFLPIRRLI